MLLGITGSDGAGKGTVVDYLVTKHGFVHYSSRDTIAEVVTERGLPITREQLRLTANELRAAYGDDYVVRRSFEAVRRDNATRAIIESVRTLAEADFLRSQGAVLIAVDAEPDIRYRRVQQRRLPTDHVTFEAFVAHEALENNDPDPHGMQKATVMAGADYLITNNGSLADLTATIDAVLNTLMQP